MPELMLRVAVALRAEVGPNTQAIVPTHVSTYISTHVSRSVYVQKLGKAPSQSLQLLMGTQKQV